MDWIHFQSWTARLTFRACNRSSCNCEKHRPTTRFFQRSTFFAISCCSLLSREIWSIHRSRAPAMARLFQRATVHHAKARIRFLAATTHCSVRQTRASTLLNHIFAAMLVRRARGNSAHHVAQAFS